MRSSGDWYTRDAELTHPISTNTARPSSSHVHSFFGQESGPVASAVRLQIVCGVSQVQRSRSQWTEPLD